MKYFNQLDLVETEIIRLGELTKLYNVISNGANSSNREHWQISSVCSTKHHLVFSTGRGNILISPPGHSSRGAWSWSKSFLENCPESKAEPAYGRNPNRHIIQTVF